MLFLESVAILVFFLGPSLGDKKRHVVSRQAKGSYSYNRLHVTLYSAPFITTSTITLRFISTPRNNFGSSGPFLTSFYFDSSLLQLLLVLFLKSFFLPGFFLFFLFCFCLFSGPVYLLISGLENVLDYHSLPHFRDGCGVETLM